VPKRILAVLTTLLLAIGLTVGVTSAASAHIPAVEATCTTLDVTLSSYGVNSINYVTVTIDGNVVENHTMFGDNFAKKQYPIAPTTSSHTWKVEIDAAHNGHDRLGASALTGTWIPCASTDLTCDVATLYKGSPLSNGDHINMDVVRNGSTFQVNAYIDLRQASDPASESGLVVRVHLDTGDLVLPLTNAQKASGIFAFSYSSSWTGTWTVEWVQYNSKYFNQDRDSTKFLHCDKDTPVTITAEPSATPPTCFVDGKLVVPTTAHVTWTGGANGAGTGTYLLKATADSGYTLGTAQSTWSITVLPKGSGVNCEQSVKPDLTIAECHPTTGAVTSAFITIPSTTPHLSYSIGATIYAAGQQVPLAPGTHTVTVTAAANWTNTGPGSYTIVVAALGCDKAVEPALTQAQCSTTTPPTVISAYITIPSTTPHLTYSIGATSYASGQKVDLAAGSHTVTVTPDAGWKNTGPSSFTIVVASLGCEKSVEPALTAAVCTTATPPTVTSAYLTIPSTAPHLTYSIGATTYAAGEQVPLTPGSYVVTVTADAGWKNTGPGTFTISVDPFDCEEAVEPLLTPAVCTPLTGPFAAYVTIPTTTPHLIYSYGGTAYPAGAKVDLPSGPYTITVTAEPGWKNTGPASFSGTVDPVSCVEVAYVEPTIAPESCDTDLGGKTQGSLAFKLDPDLAYYLQGSLVTSTTPILLDASTYAITVVPSVGHYLKNGIDTYYVTIDPAVGCDGLYTTPLDPYADPETCDPLSIDGEKVDGSVSVVHVAGVQFSIGTLADGSDKVAVGTAASVGTVAYPYAAGSYYVFAESKDPAITIKPGHTLWGPLIVKVPEPVCLPTRGLLEADAQPKDAVCDAFGSPRGSITVLPTPGVTYAFEGGAKITTTATSVAPGTYTIVATADDGISTLTASRWVVTVATSLAVCDLTTLAFTGQNPTGWVILAVLLLQAGLVLVAVRFVRNRRDARHLAA
jgi:hypothetical protein